MRKSRQPLLGLVGTGGFAREVMPLLGAAGIRHSPRLANARTVFVDDERVGELIGGIIVQSEDEFLSSTRTKFFNVAISDAAARRALASKFLSHDAEPLSIVAPTARILGSRVSLGYGAIITDFSVITDDVKIGSFFHCNLGSYVAHDCVIGDFVTFAPHVHCNGRVAIEDGAYVGAGALLRQGRRDSHLRVGANAVIGMGAVVLHDVSEDSVVVGNPARTRASDARRPDK